MIKQHYFCDADGKEFNPAEGISTIAAIIPKMNAKLEKQRFTLEGNYCSQCSEMILNFIAHLKNELKATSTTGVVEQTE